MTRPTGGDDIDIEVEDADGPPVPPPVCRRRRRRRALLIGAVAIVVVVGVPIGLVAGLGFGDEDAPPATADGGVDEGGDDGQDDEDGGDGQGGGGDSGEAEELGPLDPLDLDALEGSDAVYGRLLIDIDASEQVMVGFQEELSTAFAEPPEERVAALQGIAGSSRDELLEVRDGLDDGLDVDGAEEVRERYLAHLDSWAEYMDAVAEDPSILDGEGPAAGFTVVINATGDAFARALEDELPESADASVRDYADDLLDRGFRGEVDAQV